MAYLESDRLRASAPQPVRASWAPLAVLVLPVLLMSIDNTVLALAIPRISEDLHPTATQQLWMIDLYPMMMAALLITMGTLGDRIGRRRLLLVGATGFAITSFLAGFSPNAETLIAARGLLGVFGATLMPSTLALLRSTYTDDRQRRTAIAVWATGFAAGNAFGPLVGGFVLQWLPWGSVFWLAMPFLVPLLVLGPRVIEESRNPNPGRIDLASVVLSVLALGLGVLAIKEVAVHGVAVLPVALGAGGLLAGAVFWHRQKLLAATAGADPMLDLGLFGRAGGVFGVAVTLNLLALVAMAGFILMNAQYLQLVEGLSPLDASLRQLAGAAAAVVSGLAVVPLTRRFTPRAVLVASLGLGCVALLVMGAALVVGHDVSTELIVIVFAMLGGGLGASQTMAADLAIAAVPTAKAGAASAVSEVAFELGAVLGSTVIGSVLAASYRAHLALPDGLSGEQADLARETLAGAVDVTHQVTGALGGQVMTAASSAFTSAMAAGVLTGAAALALAVWLAARHVREA